MEKVLEYLEKYVEWVAVTLGGVFVLYMVYSYVLIPPAAVEINSRQLTAGQVDDFIATETAEPLALKMKDTRPIDLTVQPFEQDFLKQMANANVTTTELAFLAPRTSLGGGLVPDGPSPDAPNPDAPQPVGDVKLVELPKARPFEAKVGRSMVMMNEGGLDANGQPVGNPGGAQPGQNPFAMGVAADPNQQMAVPAADRDWATAFFKISMADLDKAWKAAGIVSPKVPQLAQQTAFLQVITEREEQTGIDAKGQPIWGNRVTVKPLSNSQLTALPDPAMPAEVQLTYLQWAEQNQAGILQPTFYVVSSGDSWAGPGAPVVPVGAPAGGNIFDDPAAGMDMMPPGVDPNDPNRKKTPAEIRAEREAIRQQKKQEADQRRQQQQLEQQQRRGGGGGGPGGSPRPPAGMPNFQVRDPNRPNMRPGGPGAGYPGGPGYPMNPGYPVGNPGQPGFGQPGGDPNAAQAFPVPPSQFVPAANLPDIMVWVHDDSVEAGKTYRYRIRYVMKNPVYNTANLAAPNVVGVFALKQDEKNASDWSSPVSVAARTQYFIASVNQNRATVKVFRWQEGRQNMKEFTVNPGDIIGGKDGAIDFTTGVTIVDIRDGGTVLMMDPNSALFTRNTESDRRNPDLKKLEGEASMPSANAGFPINR